MLPVIQTEPTLPHLLHAADTCAMLYIRNWSFIDRSSLFTKGFHFVPKLLTFSTSGTFTFHTFPFARKYSECCFQLIFDVLCQRGLGRISLGVVRKEFRTWSVRVAWTSKVESRIPSWAMTRAGCPILVTLSFSPFSPKGKASKRSRILSTDRLEAPQTSRRNGLGLVDEIVVSCRIISINVCVFPVPGVPVI